MLTHIHICTISRIIQLLFFNSWPSYSSDGGQPPKRAYVHYPCWLLEWDQLRVLQSIFIGGYFAPRLQVSDGGAEAGAREWGFFAMQVDDEPVDGTGWNGVAYSDNDTWFGSWFLLLQEANACVRFSQEPSGRFPLPLPCAAMCLCWAWLPRRAPALSPIQSSEGGQIDEDELWWIMMNWSKKTFSLPLQIRRLAGAWLPRGTPGKCPWWRWWPWSSVPSWWRSSGPAELCPGDPGAPWQKSLPMDFPNLGAVASVCRAWWCHIVKQTCDQVRKVAEILGRRACGWNKGPWKGVVSVVCEI